MLSRIFELREEVKLFLVAKQKHDLLLAFGGDGFSTYLAYLADIFEALNQLNKKLQGPGTNVIVHSDAINAFVVKINLWRQRAKNNNFASFHCLTEITEMISLKTRRRTSSAIFETCRMSLNNIFPR